MNQAQVDYAALRYTTSKDLSSVANSFKRGGVSVETVYVQRLGKRIMKFRCPPGTRRGGQWTDRLGTDCNLGPARAGLAKITRTVSRIDNALDESEQRVAQGGPGLVRYQSGRALERAGDVVDYAADSVRKRGQATRVRAGQALERAGDRVDDTAARVGRALERAGDRVDEASERLKQAYERVKQRVGVALERAGDAINDWADRRRARKAKPGGITPENDAMARELIRQMQLANLAEWAKNPKSKPSKESKLLLTPDQKKQAAQAVANRIYGAWLASRQGDDGSFEPEMVDDGNGGQINLAATDFNDWPDAWQAEWLATGASAVHAIDMDPDADDDTIAERMHDAWQARHQSWVPDAEQTYDQLDDDDKEYLQSIVAETRDVIDEIINPDDTDLEDAPEQGGWIPSDIQSAGFKKPKSKKKPKAAKQGDSEWDDLTQNERSAISYALGNDREDWINNVSQSSPYINDWFGDALASSRQAREDLANATTPYQREMARRRAEYNRRLAEWTLRRSTNPDLGEMKDVLDPASFDMANPDVFGKNGEKFSDFPHQGIDPQLLEVLEKDGLVDPEGDGFDPDLFKPFDGELPEKFVVRPAMDDLQQMAEAADTEAPGEAAAADVPEAEVPSVDKKPIPVDEEGKVPTPKRTVLDVPEDAKKPSGPAKAAGASLNDATAKNAKKTGKKLPGKQFGSVFTKEDSALKWAKQSALEEGVNVYVAKGPDGKFRLYDEERFLASGFELVQGFNVHGNIVDIQSNDLYPDATPEDAVQEVKNSVEQEAKLVAQEMTEQDLIPPSMDLKKSKTGNFLPDDFSKDMVDVEKQEMFEEAWAKQRDDVLAFWEGRVGAINDAVDGLAQIDAHIAAEKAKPDKDSGKIGVLNAERNNYLAIVMPNSGGDGYVDPYERINFVGPKRRHQIIEDAGLDNMIVSSKKTKNVKKDIAKPVGEDETLPDIAIEASPDKNPVAELSKVFNGPEQTPVTAARVQEMLDGNFADYVDADGKLDLEKYKAALNQAWYKFDDYNSQLVFQLHQGKGITTEQRDLLLKKRAEYEAHELNLNAAVDLHNKQNLEKLTEELEEEPDIDSWPESSMEEWNSEYELQIVNDWTYNEIAQQQLAKWAESQNSIPDFADQYSAEAWFDAKIVDAEIDMQEASDQYYELKQGSYLSSDDVIDNMILPELKKDWWQSQKELYLNKFKEDSQFHSGALDFSLADDGFYWVEDSVDAFTGIESLSISQINNYDDLTPEAVNGIKAAAKKGVIYHKGKAIPIDEFDTVVSAVKNNTPETVDEIVEALPDVPHTPETPIDVEKLGKIAGLQTLFDSIENFDYNKIIGHEGNSLGSTLDSIISRVGGKPYAKQANEYLSKLPDNLTDLPLEEQLAAIRSATGAPDDLTAAKFLARAAYNAQFGDFDSLSSLRKALQAHAGELSSTETEALKAFDRSQTMAEDMATLKSVSERLAALGPDVAPTLRDLLRGQANTARNNLIAAHIYEHLKALDSGDVKEMSKTGKALGTLSSGTDPMIRGQVEKILNSGITITGATPNSLSAKNAIDTAGFDSSLLGTMQGNGKAIAYAIPIGHKGLWTQEDADRHLSVGGTMSDVPDAYLKDAIFNNMGLGQRFVKIADGSIKTGYNDLDKKPEDMTTGVIDSVTGKKYVFKLPDRDHMSHVQEAAMARLSQILGNPATGIRFGSEPVAKALDAGRAKEEGTKTGSNRWIVMEHVGNLFDDESYKVLGHLHEVDQLPEGAVLDGASLARLMVLDRASNYYDRKAGNIIAVQGPDGRVHLHPLDHPNAFRAFAGVDEQAAGFIQPGKNDQDQLRLITLAKSLPAEERVAFANALVDAVKRFNKADFNVAFDQIASTMNVTQAEKERFEKHASYLNDKRSNLDFNKMTQEALGQLGFSMEEIAVFQAGGAFVSGTYAPGFDVPSAAGRLSNLKSSLDNAPIRSAYVTLNYGGSQIEAMEVRSQKIKFKLPKAKADDPMQDGVQMLFKRRDTALSVDPVTDPQWKKLPRKGHVAAHPGSDPDSPFEIDFTDPWIAVGTVASNPNNKIAGEKNKTIAKADNQTYYRILSDGTVATITIGTGDTGYGPEGRRSTVNQTVRLIFPGGAEDVTQERVAAAMEAVGVTTHGDPTPEQVRTYGISATYASLFGYVPENASTGELINKISAEYGITEDMFETRISNTGKISVQLTKGGVQELSKHHSARILYHTGAGYVSTLKSVILQSELLSTQRRHEHGPDQNGQSSAEDMGRGGSGDFVYTGKYQNPPETFVNYQSGMIYFPAEVLLRRTDWHAFPGDAWGDVAKYKSAKIGLNSTGNEVDLRGAVDISHGIIIVEPSTRDELIAFAHAHGRSEINGVPIEDIIVTNSQAQDAMQKVLERWDTED